MVKGTGVDIVSVARIARVLGRREGFAERILTENELELFRRRSCSCEFLAGRFSAKEAVMKALGTGLAGGITFRDVEVLPGPSGAPAATLRGKALEAFGSLGGKFLFLSISTEREYAVSLAVIEG